MNQVKETYRLIFSGGGTGGHIYPAITVAKRFVEKHPESDILFVGARGKMEMEAVPAAGFRIIGLIVSGFHRKITLKNILFPFKLFMALQKARKIIKDFKPDAVIGFGGFASGPVLKIAARIGIPTMIQEQNSYAGVTNKLLGKKANTVCVAYEEMNRYFPSEKIVITGNPIRPDIFDTDNKKISAMDFFRLDTSRKTLLVMGGSLGARSINESLIKNIDLIIDNGVQLIWQIGKIYFREFDQRLSGKNLENIRYYEFLDEMDLAYAAADVVISRAGALSVSELCIAGKPAIFVPSPNVAEDHQTKNAAALSKTGASLIVPDHEAGEKLVRTALDLIADDEKMAQLSVNIKKLAKPSATDNIVAEIEKLLN